MPGSIRWTRGSILSFANVNRRLDSLGEQLDAIARGLNARLDGIEKKTVKAHGRVLVEHGQRLQDLERVAQR